MIKRNQYNIGACSQCLCSCQVLYIIDFKLSFLFRMSEIRYSISKLGTKASSKKWENLFG